MGGAMQVRFWRYLNGGAVRIKLNSGQVLHWFRREKTDEGWKSRAEEYSHDEKTLFLQWQNDGRDCDGRHTTGGLSGVDIQGYCEGTRINKREPNDRGPEDITYPAWVNVINYPVYDEYARAAGY
jgi:hypothetical protein